jgi:hypothetical protein
MEYLSKAEQSALSPGIVTSSTLTTLGLNGAENVPAVAITSKLTHALTGKKYIDTATSIMAKATLDLFGTASTAHVLAGKTFTSLAGLTATGTMTNHGAVTPSVLGPGGSYTIPKGYHNGNGKVTAASLAASTSGTAAAAHIASGKTAWVNGSQVTGTMPAYNGQWLRPNIDEFDGADLNMTCTIDQGWYVTKDQTLSIAANINELIEYIGIAEEMSF